MITISPAKAGALGALFATLFFVVFVVLGFIQPGYNHLRTTISSLVVGEFGWIQTINFIFLALSFAFIGFGLGKNITRKNVNKIFLVFGAISISILCLMLIPTDKLDPYEPFHFGILSITGRIHYLFVLALILLTPFMFFVIVKHMRKNKSWKSFVPYTNIMMTVTFIVSIMWFGLVNFGYLAEIKGLIQKLLATNVLAWLVFVGYKLWRIESGVISDDK